MSDNWKFINRYCDENFIKRLVKYGYKNPTKVQRETIPKLLNNKDVKVIATTGSGKTAAFVIPSIVIIRKKIKQIKKHSTCALVLSPTRELAQQTHRVFSELAGGEMSACLFLGGDHKKTSISDFLKNGGHILISTPGILDDILTNNNFNSNFSNENLSDLIASAFQYIEILILDEADKLIEMGFFNQITHILSFVPRIRRTGLFSASDSPKLEILSSKILRNPIFINISDNSNCVKTFSSIDSNSHLPSSLENFYKICKYDSKFSYLCNFLIKNKNLKIIIFFATNFMVEYFGQLIKKLCDVSKLYMTHGKAKNRLSIYDDFKKFKKCILLCSDLIARGVDFFDVDWVIQFEPPRISSTFVHRCGRTARMGKEGKSLTLLYPHEINYVSFIDINQNIKLDNLDDGEVPLLSDRIKKFATKDRNIYIKGLKAFTSFINFYIQHECKNIFSLKEMDIGEVSNDFGLLHIPHMQELVGLNTQAFIKTEIDHTKIKFKDKTREKLRKKICKNKL